MTTPLTLDELAVHFVDIKNKRIELAGGTQDTKKLDPLVTEFLIKLVHEVWDAEDSGVTNSARFANNSSAQLVEQQINSVKNDGNAIFDSSVILARHLFDKSAPNASPGLFGVLRLIHSTNNRIFVAILKIEIKNQKFVKLQSSALTQLTVEDVDNMLLEKIQKGAIFPHPQKSTYHLKLIDKQATSGETAKYFSKAFLGCDAKIADEHQVKKLLPELEKYADIKGLPLRKEKIPDFLTALKKENRDISTPFVTRVANDLKIFGDEFKPDDFQEYIDESSSIGPIDIPAKQFGLRGKTGRISRELTIELTDKKYKGLKISGPETVLSSIMSFEGDTVTITISTTMEGYKSVWE